MKRRLTIISLLCTLIAALSVAAASDFGPPVGSRLSAVGVPLGPKGAAILLSPAGARARLSELDQHRAAFQKLGVGVGALDKFAGRTPSPGWFVLDAKGVIVAKYFDDDPSQCLTSAALLIHQFGWTPPEPAVAVEGKQLSASLRASNSNPAPGQRVALMLDVDLEPNMHVYAPGVEGYIPIDWKMQDSDTAQVHAPVFPRAEKLYLKAIDETVPAYRNHFRLVRDITIKPAAEGAGRFTVDGSLRYQACDDRVCYIPQTLRLQWTFEYQALAK